jgi:hypothetical protein
VDEDYHSSDPYGYAAEDERYMATGRPVDDDAEPDEQVEIAEYMAEVRRAAA